MSQSFGRVGVLYGGTSAEREVSLLSGAGVCEALRAEGVDAHLFDTGRQDLPALAAAGFDRVFIALHGCYGEDGTMQGALELIGLPYTGSGPTASGVAMDKIMTKRLWLHHGLPTPAFRTLAAPPDPADLAAALGLPMIMKPPHEGSTVGVTRVDEADMILPAYEQARRFDDVVLAERYIQGRELTVPILGSGAGARALPVIEIIAPGGNYDYEHKYFSDETRYVDHRPWRQLRLRAQVFLGRDPLRLSRRARRGAGAAHPAHLRGGLPGPGMRRMGPGGPDAGCGGRALAARDEHVARDDEPFPGAHGRQGGRHELWPPVCGNPGLGALQAAPRGRNLSGGSWTCSPMPA